MWQERFTDECATLNMHGSDESTSIAFVVWPALWCCGSVRCGAMRCGNCVRLRVLSALVVQSPAEWPSVELSPLNGH